MQILDVALRVLSQPVLFVAESYEELYCFSYKPNIDGDKRWQEWDFLDVTADYNRMGLPDSLWKLSPVNRHYKVSELTSVFNLVWTWQQFRLLFCFFFKGE